MDQTFFSVWMGGAGGGQALMASAKQYWLSWIPVFRCLLLGQLKIEFQSSTLGWASVEWLLLIG